MASPPTPPVSDGEKFQWQKFQCRCIWHHVRCPKAATQEDGKCDWCGDRRPEDLRENEFASWGLDGKFLGLGGGTVTGYVHQAGMAGIPDWVRPSACWMEKNDV